LSIIASAQRVFRRIILAVRVAGTLMVAYDCKSVGVGLDQLVEAASAPAQLLQPVLVNISPNTTLWVAAEGTVPGSRIERPTRMKRDFLISAPNLISEMSEST